MDQQEVEAAIHGFLQRVQRDIGAVDRDTALFAGGIGLDSLETAELAAVLEDELGTDPFTEAEQMPQTIGEILDFYASPAAGG